MASSYIQAGYMPLIGCRLDVALEDVRWHLSMQMEDKPPVRYNEANYNIEVDLGGLFVPTEYYWDDNILLRRIK